jgi:GNAT superfamily N-acetyltransferase
VIDKAVREEAAVIMIMIGECIARMAEMGIRQWDEHYPTLAIIQTDIAESSGYVMREGREIAAYFCMDTHQSPEYAEVDWTPADEPIFTVHRLCVRPRYQGQGIARRIMAFVEAAALERGCGAIRIDTYSRNMPALALYKSLGYAIVGQVHFRSKDYPFFCMEKILLDG